MCFFLFSWSNWCQYMDTNHWRELAKLVISVVSYRSLTVTTMEVLRCALLPCSSGYRCTLQERKKSVHTIISHALFLSYTFLIKESWLNTFYQKSLNCEAQTTFLWLLLVFHLWFIFVSAPWQTKLTQTGFLMLTFLLAWSTVKAERG